MIFKGKNIVVTGANRGLGRATVEAFAVAGANVWACARKPSETFEHDMAEVAEKNGVIVKPVYFDLTDADAVKAGIMGIASGKRTVDVLVNNLIDVAGGL